jgi:two-component system response regulator VicR
MDKKFKILIVEDDEYVAKVYRLKFESEGMEPVISGDGEDAVEKILSIKPDLVLLDLMLPKKDGFWVLEKVRQNPVSFRTPVIVLSNVWEQADKERALVLGANDFLVKIDTSIQEVVDKVKERLKG